MYLKSFLAEYPRIASLTAALLLLIASGGGWMLYQAKHALPLTLRVGCNSFPPYILPQPSGPPKGIAVEMITLAAKLTGIRIEWVFIGNQTADEALASRRIDLFALLTLTPGRAAQFHMSQPWWENQMALISLDRRKLAEGQAVSGKIVAIRGMAVAKRLAIDLFPGAKFAIIPQMERMLPALCAGEVDGVFLDLRLVQSQLLQQGGCKGEALYVASLPNASLSLATASTLATAPVADKLYEGIMQLSGDGTLSRIASKWALYNPYSGRYVQEMMATRHRANLMRYGLGGMLLVLILTCLQTQRIRRERAIALAARHEADESRYKFDAFMKFTPAFTCIKDADGRVVYANQAFLKQFERKDVIGQTLWNLWPAETADSLHRNNTRVLATNQSQEFTESVTSSAGELKHYLSLKFPFSNRGGQDLVGVVSLDITERKRAEEALRLSQFCIDRSPDTILWFGSDGRIFYSNEAATLKLGYSREELNGMPLQVLDPGCDEETLQHASAEMKDGKSVIFESTHRTRSGFSFPVEVIINQLRSENRTFACCMARDITERKQAERELSHQAGHDLLTGLPNRRTLEHRLAQVLETAHSQGRTVGVVCIDLDGFKLVNDTLGHATGDRLLKQVAARLRSCLSESDTLARMGGDEFTLILDPLKNAEEARAMAQTLLISLNAVFELDGNELLVAASAGVSLFPRDAADVSGLLQSSDAAMYEAKRQGKNKVQFFTPEMRETATERLELETQLRRALDRKELSLHFQPQVSLLGGGGVVRYEALLRWDHPLLGSIPPMKFIPIAEDTSLIVPIGTWALEEACRHACEWRKAWLNDTGVGVNVSVVQFLRPDFVDTVIGVLERTGLPPYLLELEITESVVMQGMEDPARKIEQLRALGVSISIDDFGTGYSSLSYLQRLPIDNLKIDRAFIRDIASNPDSIAVAAALVSLAHSLGMKVVIEGIETGQQLEAVRRIGCDMVQGFLLGRPAPFRELFPTSSAAA